MRDPDRNLSVPEAAPTRDAAFLERLLDAGVRSMDVMLTTRCNLRCAYCHQARGFPREMPAEILSAAIRRLVTSRLVNPRLTLFGGEPLLSPRLVRLALDEVRALAPPNMRPDVRIFTNGLCLDEDMTRLLVERDVHITLSMDGIAAAQDARAPGSFAPLDRLLVRLRRNHPEHFRARVTVQATLTSRNVLHLSESFRSLVSRGVEDISVVPMHPEDGGWDSAAGRELDRQLGAVVERSLEEFRLSGRIPFSSFRSGGSPMDPAGAPACAWGRRDALFVDVDGTIAPCAAVAPSVLAAAPPGLRETLEALGGVHVLDPGFPAALVRREFRAGTLDFPTGVEAWRDPRGPCAGCAIRDVCFVCPVAVASSGGRPPAIHCDANRLFAFHGAAFRAALSGNHSHSIVPGGFDVTS